MKIIQSKYDEQYTDRMTPYRELVGKYKSQNIIKVVDGKSFQKVLDFGAGEGSILKYLDKNNQFKELYAVEISDCGIAKIEKRRLENLREVKKFDGYNTEYSDNEFDLIYCSHFIEHVEFPRLVLREIKRISKFQVFEIPLDYGKNVDSRITHCLEYGHINIFTPSLFRFLLKSEGFEIENETYSVIKKEVLEFNWYQNLQIKRTLMRKILAYLYTNKSIITRMLFGKEISKEFYNTTYTCFTSQSEDLPIFEVKRKDFTQQKLNTIKTGVFFKPLG